MMMTEKLILRSKSLSAFTDDTAGLGTFLFLLLFLFRMLPSSLLSLVFAAIGNLCNTISFWICCSWCGGRYVDEGPGCPFHVRSIDSVDECCRMHDAYGSL